LEPNFEPFFGPFRVPNFPVLLGFLRSEGRFWTGFRRVWPVLFGTLLPSVRRPHDPTLYVISDRLFAVLGITGFSLDFGRAKGIFEWLGACLDGRVGELELLGK
jgi:hypothetical protein